MRICTRCEQDKPDEDFFYRDKKTGKRHSHCKECYSKARKQTHERHYKKNKEAYKRRAKELKVRNQERLLEYLHGKKCKDCGEDDIVVLDFDHVDPRTKRDSVSKLVRQTGWETVLVEISKCEIVCSNCHRRRTTKAFGSYRVTR